MTSAAVDWTVLLAAFCPNGIWDDGESWDDGGIWREGEVWTEIATSDPTDGI